MTVLPNATHVSVEQLIWPTEFEHDPLPDYIPHDVQEQMREVETHVRLAEEPLYRRFRRYYPAKFPRVCGGASIAMAHIVSRRSRLPILPRGAPGPHNRITLYPSIFNPHNLEGWPGVDEHTWFACRFRDFSLTVDPTIRLAYGMAAETGATRIEWQENHLLQTAAQEATGMYTPEVYGRLLGGSIWGWGDGSSFSHDEYHDMVHIMHSSDVFEPVAELSLPERTYDVAGFWGPTLKHIIDETLAEMPAVV